MAAMPRIADYYHILGIDPGASKYRIRKAYYAARKQLINEGVAEDHEDFVAVSPPAPDQVFDPSADRIVDRRGQGSSTRRRRTRGL
jgi:DnaJ-class molecular chaperone